MNINAKVKPKVTPILRVRMNCLVMGVPGKHGVRCCSMLQTLQKSRQTFADESKKNENIKNFTTYQCSLTSFLTRDFCF